MEWGAIERYWEADWVLWGVVDREQIANPQFRFQDKEVQYNQDEYKSNTCTVYQAMGAYSDLRGKEIPLIQRKELVDLAIEWGLDVDEGWYLDSAVKLVAKYFWDVSWARVKTGSPDYAIAKNKWFSLMEWYGGNRTYNRDRDDNGVVDTNDWGTRSYWHARRSTSTDTRVDNYSIRPTNVYRLPELGEKIKSGNIFVYSYFYFDKIELPMVELPKHITDKEVRTGDQKDIIKARETEMWVTLANWGKLLYTNYYSVDPRDYPQILARMLNDLQEFRRK